MRRTWLIAAPIAVLLATGTMVGIWRAQSRNPIAPLQKFVVFQETFFVPSNPASHEDTVQVWAWLKGSENAIPAYGKWLKQEQGWNVRENDGMGFQAMRGGVVEPDETLALSPDGHGLLLIYSRRVSPIDALYFSRRYKNLDVNSPTPQRPQWVP